jgi:hypothetical protein
MNSDSASESSLPVLGKAGVRERTLAGVFRSEEDDLFTVRFTKGIEFEAGSREPVDMLLINNGDDMI